MTQPRIIPYGRHSVDEQDVASVTDVLTNKFLTQGETVPKFEQALASYCQAKHAVAVNSGTSGLHVACLAAGVTSGDLVWTVPISFVASANCALYCGADVDFVDIDPATRNISIQHLSAKLNHAQKSGRLPNVLIVVHFTGQSCDMKAIRQLTQPHGIVLIEDAAHALGATYDGKPVGNCQYSDMAVMSFHPVKSITTAEGGAVLTNDAKLHQRLTLFAKHGVTRDESLMEGDTDGPWYYQQVALGFNYRLSDIHAALGLSQLSRLDAFVDRRKELAAQYLRELSHLPITLPSQQNLESSAWHLFVIEVKSKPRLEVFNALQKRGVGVNVHYIPIHLQPFYQKLGFSKGDFPHAETFYNNAMTLPLFPELTADELKHVIQALKEVLA